MGSKIDSPRFVVCIRSDDNAELEVRKIYEVLPDDSAASDGLLRVVDDSGENYLYPESLFLRLELLRAVDESAFGSLNRAH